MSKALLLNAAASGAAGSNPVYVDDVFSTHLYKGNSSSTPRTISNGINLQDEGGLVWIKARTASENHMLYDSERTDSVLFSNSDTNEFTNLVVYQRAVNLNKTDGFEIDGFDGSVNSGSHSYVSWTFRKQEGFFDVVTYTGNGSARTISHNLGSVPGMIIVKRRDSSGDWQVYHRSNTASPETDYLALNEAAATADSNTRWNDTAPTSSVFSVGTEATVNASNGTYVAYLFAHDTQDFGTDSDEAIIKCGSYTGNGTSSTSTQHLDLGFEPQFFLVKVTSMSGQEWFMYDVMRGLVGEASASGDMRLMPSSADGGEYQYLVGHPTATGLQLMGNESEVNKSGQSYIYMAIRRSHKPASEFAATELFKTVAGRSDSTSPSYETGFVTDMGIQRRPATAESNLIFSRLTGNKYYDTDNNSDAEATGSSIAWDYMNGAVDYFSSAAYRFWGWKRAPGFFDVVRYTGTGSARTIAHNLGAVPEMIWVIPRSSAERKPVYNKESGNQVWNDLTYPYTGNADSAGAYWNSTTPTASVFSVGTTYRVNGNNDKYVAYLFASVNGISKIGSYTGTGSSDINIDCGFSNGARFVLIKCIGGNAAGNHYYLFDSERGIATGNDPYIVLDDTSTSAYGAQDAIDPLSSGFKVRSTAVDGINANGGTYLFYAIA